ncbi:MAG TPA: dCTP deaminase [Candidatus Thermoplasmatota archaeon]|nr:dCTP deaminase [Candidatus Thermoplasmatota archaeon]
MILSDRDILDRLRKGDLVVDPIDDLSVQVQPASIDLRLGEDFLVFRHTAVPFIDPSAEPSEPYTEPIHIPRGGTFVLHPGEFALGTTHERVAIPNDLVARVDGRSSLGRLAVVVHSTAGFIDPGFRGRITLELSNLGRIPVALRPGMRVCQLSFETMTSAAERPYGPARGSKYQDQQGPVASRIGRDREAR